MTDVALVNFAPLILPQTLGLARDRMTPEADRGPTYDARYDFHTLVCDAVHLSGEGVVRLFCPPLLNLAPLLLRGEIRLDGQLVRPGRRRRRRRFEMVDLPAVAPPERLTVRHGGWRGSVRVSSDADCASFAGLNCLVTLSRDNPLPWIRDWARWHVAEHGAEAALFLDNGSTIYPPRALAETLGEAGLRVVRVGRIDLPYGPVPLRGSRSKGMFLQQTLLNLVRFRFLRDARAVLQNDVDELVLRGRSGSVFDAAAEARSGFVKFRGMWRVPMGDREPALHRDHWGMPGTDRPCPAKYCVVPSGRMRRHDWNVHNLDRVLFSRRFESRQFSYLHCQGISTRWKSETSRRRVGACGEDPVARAALERVLG